jgi:hypothetical protein
MTYPGKQDKYDVGPFLNSVLRAELPDKLIKISQNVFGDARTIPIGWRYLLGEMRLGSYHDMDLTRVPKYARLLMARLILFAILIQYFGERIGLALLPFEDFSADIRLFCEKLYGTGSAELKKFDESYSASWKGFKNSCGDLYLNATRLSDDGTVVQKTDQLKRCDAMLEALSNHLAVSRKLLKRSIGPTIDKLLALILWVMEIDSKGNHSPALTYMNWFVNTEPGNFPFSNIFLPSEKLAEAEEGDDA